MPKSVLAKLLWLGIAILGASAIGGIAIHRGESIKRHLVYRGRRVHLPDRLPLLQRMDLRQGAGA